MTQGEHMDKECGNEVKINDVLYVRRDSIEAQSPLIGDKRIIITDREWVFVGDCTDNEDGSVTISNAKNIRRWGTTKGLGELSDGPTASTIADDYGTVQCTPIFTIGVMGGW
jgi:hypothetical protein